MYVFRSLERLVGGKCFLVEQKENKSRETSEKDCPNLVRDVGLSPVVVVEIR